MTKITDIPAIRFKGFSDTWEQRKFSDLVQIERGGSPRPIDDFITDSPDGLNWVKIGDAPAQGNYITKTAEKIKPEGLSKTREVHPGDLILSNSMSFGKPYIMGIDGCIHDGWLLIRNTYKVFDLTFLCHLLGTPQMIIQYKSLAAGSTVNNLNKELVGNTVVTIPTIKEQRVLGQYLETLDNLITLHQCKCQIDGCRFQSPLAITWEQRKLLEFGLATGGTSIESEFSEDGVYKVISIGSYSEDNVYRDQGIRAVRSDKTVNRILNKGDITMILNDKTASGNIIGRVLLIEESGVYVYNQRTERIEVDNSNYDSQFIYTMLNAPAIRDRIIKQSQGNTQIYVNWTTISQTDYLVPQFSEQRKIGEYFANLDHLITLHQRELEKLQNIKKAMLEKMFV